MKTVLVTGATGALGQAVVARLRKAGICRVLPASRHAVGDDVVQLNLRDAESLTETVDGIRPDLVLHLAATFVNDFDEAYAVNVEATKNLLDAVQQSGASTRVLLAGSAAEYGVVRLEENPIREDHVLAPVSIYGMSKAWQTQLAGVYAGRGLDVVVARIFNLDGPSMSERLFIGRLQKQIDEVLAKRQSVIELGPLSAVRDYVSTDEAARQILAIAAHAQRGRVHHVASGVPVRMRELLKRRLAAHGLDPAIVREAAELSNRIGYDVPAIYADVTGTMHLVEMEEKCRSLS